MTNTLNLYDSEITLDPFYPINANEYFSLYRLYWCGLYCRYNKLELF